MKETWVLDPTLNVTEDPILFAPRPDSLKNLRIGLVDNTKYNSDRLLLKIAALFEQKYGARSHLLRRKDKAGVSVPEAMISEFKAGCDLVIAGIGD